MTNRTRMQMMEYSRRGQEPESRRRRYSNGRYAPSSYADDMDEMYEPNSRRGGSRMEMHQGSRRNKNVQMMGTIGFRQEPEEGEGLPWEIAEEWVKSMSQGGKPKFSYEQVEQLAQKHKCECDPVELWAVMNALHSDYGKVLRKHGLESISLYMELAVAWLEDEDAVEDKAMAYYECIVAK